MKRTRSRSSTVRWAVLCTNQILLIGGARSHHVLIKALRQDKVRRTLNFSIQVHHHAPCRRGQAKRSTYLTASCHQHDYLGPSYVVLHAYLLSRVNPSSGSCPRGWRTRHRRLSFLVRIPHFAMVLISISHYGHELEPLAGCWVQCSPRMSQA